MTVLLRLQGLHVEAGSEDIRTFFEGVRVPEGGVCIVGGSLGEAFIRFASQRDGQLAMRRSGGLLRGCRVTLYISSLEELKRKIDSKLQQKQKMESTPQQLKYPQSTVAEPTLPTVAPPLAPSPDAATAIIIGLLSALHGVQSNQQEESNNPVPLPVSPTRSEGTAAPVEESTRSSPGYVRLFGLPSSVTKQDICCFFKGLQVQEAVTNVKLSRVCCLVKFADTQKASDALRFNNRWFGPHLVEVRGASEKIWTFAVQGCDGPTSEPEVAQYEVHERPVYDEPRGHSSSPSRIGVKRCSSEERSLYTSPKRARSNCVLPVEVYYVMVKNLSKTTTKTDIKDLFGCTNIPNSRVIHLLDKERQRTDTAFLIFHEPQNYVNAMNLSGCQVGSQTVEVSSITCEKMKAMLKESRGIFFSSEQEFPLSGYANKRKMFYRQKPKVTVVPTAQTCLYVRNMPADVQKNDVKKLFGLFKLRDRFIVFLCEGEAVVQFKTEKSAAMAQQRNGEYFLGSRVLITRISFQKMQELCEHDQ